MAETKGYEYDIFISYAHNDNYVLSGDTGWVTQFHELLSNWLKRQRGLKNLTIWFDESNLQGNTRVDDEIKSSIEKSALFFVIHSKNYEESQYCNQELDWFLDYNQKNVSGIRVGNESRLFNIQIQKLHFEKWPEKLSGTSGFKLHDANEREDLGFPTSSESNRKLFDKQMRKVVEAAEKTIEALNLQAPDKPKSVLISQEVGLPKIFIANVSDSLKSFRNQLISEIGNKAIVLDSLPPPYDVNEHSLKLNNILLQSSLSVHLLDQFSGTEIIGATDGATFPRVQADTARLQDQPSLMWISDTLKVEDIEESDHAIWLHKLENGKRQFESSHFIRSSRQNFTDQVIQTIKQLTNSTNKPKQFLNFCITTHQKDQGKAYELANVLEDSGVTVEFNKESSNPIKSLENFEKIAFGVEHLIIMFGKVSPEWVSARIHTAFKIIANQLPSASPILENIWVFMLPHCPGEKVLQVPSLLKINYIDNIAQDTIAKAVIDTLVGENNVLTTPNLKNPFVGLRPFEISDSLYYFGRNAETKTLLELLYNNRFVGVIGSSGAGKSSLIRAGLIPQLEAGFLVQERDHWLIASLKPGDTPLTNLINSLINSINSGLSSPLVSQDKRRQLIQEANEYEPQGLLHLLESELSGSDKNLFVLVDQFEELFRFGLEKGIAKNRQQAEQFVALLLNLSKKDLPIYLCLTIRSDFLGDCDAFYGLPEAINQSQFLVPRLSRNQRQEVITSPINLAGAKITPRLVDKLLNESIDTRDDLPILQHTLMRMWDEWHLKGSEGSLDIEHYEKVYTIHNALDRHVNEALGELSKKQKKIAKILFQALTSVDKGNRRIRRPVHINEVSSIANARPEEVMRVIDYFCKDNRSFLVLSTTEITKNPLIDISHESLIRQWKTLGEWAIEESIAADTYQRLVETSNRYNENRAGLLQDIELEQALDWQKQLPRNGAAKIWASRYDNRFVEAIDFLHLSENSHNLKLTNEKKTQRQTTELLQEKAKLEEQKRRLAEQQSEEQKKSLTITRWLSGLLALLTIFMFSIAEYAREKSKAALTAEALSQKNEKMAEEALERAKTKELEANFNLAKAYEEKSLFSIARGDALINDDESVHNARNEYRRALLYALEAQQRPIINGKNAIKASTLDRVASIDDSILNTEKFQSPKISKGSVSAIAYSPDGRIIASGSYGNSIHLWNANSGQIISNLEGHKESVFTLQYSPDGKTIASGSDDNTIRLWNSKTHKTFNILKGHKDSIRTLTFSPDGNHIASGSNDRTIRIWDSMSGVLIKNIDAHSGSLLTLDYSPDGRHLASGSSDNTIRIWNAQTGGAVATLSQQPSQVRSLSYSPNGKLIAAGSGKAIFLWDVQSQKLLMTLKGHSKPVNYLVFSPDGNTLASGSDDDIVQLWDVKSGHIISTLQGHSHYIRTLAFSPNGKVLASGSADRTIRYWDTKISKTKNYLRGHNSKINALSFSPDGNVIASGSTDNSIRLWSVKDGESIGVLKGHTSPIMKLAYSPEGNYIASGSLDNTIRVWDTQTNSTVRTLKEHYSSVSLLGYNDEGKIVISNPDHETNRMWNTQQNLIFNRDHSKAASLIEISPDGRTIASSSEQNTVLLKRLDNPLYKLVMDFDAMEVSGVLCFLWELEPVELNFKYKPRPKSINRQLGYRIAWTADTQKYRPLLDMPEGDDTKMDQVVKWLEKRCAYKQPERYNCTPAKPTEKIPN